MAVAFNPDYLADGVEAVVGDEVVHRDARRAEAGGHPLDRAGRLPVPAHARAGAVTACCG